MAASDILNPDASSPYSPDYPPAETLPPLLATFQPRSGRIYTRQQSARGRVIEMEWRGRSLAQAMYLRQWEAQYRADFFSYYAVEAARYFSGRFAEGLSIAQQGYERWNVKGTFIEIPDLPMYAYPSNWTRDSIAFEERNGFGEDVWKQVGTWIYQSGLSRHSGSLQAAILSNATNDYAEFRYFGYGFRLYSAKAADYGIMAVSLDGGAETDVDLYAAATTNFAVVHTETNVKLGFHTVKVRVTGRKNAASSNYYAVLDKIEVMQ